VQGKRGSGGAGNRDKGTRRLTKDKLNDPLKKGQELGGGGEKLENK